MSDLDEDALIDALETAERAQLIDEVHRPTRRRTVHLCARADPLDAARGVERPATSAPASPRRTGAGAGLCSSGGGFRRARSGGIMPKPAMARRRSPYLLQAGDQAREVYAYQEAIEHYQQALALLAHLPDNSKREQRELAIQIALGNALIAAKGHAAPEVRRTFERAIDLCRQIGDVPNLWRVWSGLYRFSLARGDVHAAYGLQGASSTSLAHNRLEVDLFTYAQAALGMVSLYGGEFIRAQACFATGMSRYDSKRFTDDLLGEDAGVTCLSY